MPFPFFSSPLSFVSGKVHGAYSNPIKTITSSRAPQPGLTAFLSPRLHLRLHRLWLCLTFLHLLSAIVFLSNLHLGILVLLITSFPVRTNLVVLACSPLVHNSSDVFVWLPEFLTVVLRMSPTCDGVSLHLVLFLFHLVAASPAPLVQSQGYCQ